MTKSKEENGTVIIEEHDFRMESSRPRDIRFFDLYLPHVVNAGKENERTELKLEGYGICIDNCLKRIASLRFQNEGKTKFDSFASFVKEYKKYRDEMGKLFDSLPTFKEL